MTNHRTDLPNESPPNPSPSNSHTPPPIRSSIRTYLSVVLLILLIAGSVYAMLTVLDPAGKRSGDVVPADETYGASSIDDARVVEYDGSFDLENYVKKNESVVLELKTDWCGYCKEFESRLGDIIERDADVKVVMVDVEKYGEFGKRFNVVGTPTFVRYESGKQKDVRVGSLGTDEFVKWINE